MKLKLLLKMLPIVIILILELTKIKNVMKEPYFEFFSRTLLQLYPVDKG